MTAPEQQKAERINQVTKLEDHTPAPISDATAIIQVIERAAMNPAVDVDKMERLLAMHERMRARDAEMAFNEAMTLAQAEMRAVSVNATNKQTGSKYATYEKLDAALRPIYTKFGFAISYNTADCPMPECVRVVALVSHSSGHSRPYHIDMPADGKGAKGGDVMTKTHATGAALSYGSRYLLKGIFNVAIGEEDRDGNPIDAPKITADQINRLHELASDYDADLPKFLKYMGVEKISDIPAAQYALAFNTMKAKGAKE